MTCWVVIPIKALDDCKTRLRPALTDAARRTLVQSMLANVLRAAQGAASVDRIALLGPDRHNAPASILHLTDPGLDLNAALTSAAQSIYGARLIIVAADLPHITSADIMALAQTKGAAIGPDCAGAGTNALSLPLPQAREFQFQFGERSFARHQAEAARLGLTPQIIHSPTLGLDIDTPADLAALGRS